MAAVPARPTATTATAAGGARSGPPLRIARAIRSGTRGAQACGRGDGAPSVEAVTGEVLAILRSFGFEG